MIGRHEAGPVLVMGILIFLVSVGIYFYLGNPSSNSTPQTQNEFQTVSAPHTTGKVCGAADLEGSATWQGPGNALDGMAHISNRSGVDCMLTGNPIISVASKSFPSDASFSQQGISQPVLLSAGGHARLDFSWSNWCGAVPSATSVRIELPENLGYLLIPFIAGNGSPQAYAPSCSDRQSRSVISHTPWSIDKSGSR